MSPPPRRLSFAVGTTLLTASLATAAVGCAKKNTVNVAQPEPDEPPHVNEGPEVEETVNEGPVDEPADADADAEVDAGADADADPDADADQ